MLMEGRNVTDLYFNDGITGLPKYAYPLPHIPCITVPVCMLTMLRQIFDLYDMNTLKYMLKNAIHLFLSSI